MKFRSSASPCGLDPSPGSKHHFRIDYTMDVENTCLLGSIDGFATSGTYGRSSERMHGRNRVYILLVMVATVDSCQKAVYKSTRTKTG